MTEKLKYNIIIIYLYYTYYYVGNEIDKFKWFQLKINLNLRPFSQHEYIEPNRSTLMLG
jgi:hypothetical protein